MADKVFCDPVHRHIVFDKNADAVLLDLIACPELQRLRRVRQLGVSSYTYPGAEHSRFGHALGTCHVMTQALDVLARNQPDLDLDDDVRLAARCAALLHDIGHGPFSHLTERICGFKHSRLTDEIIRGETGVNEALRARGEGFPKLVASLLEREDSQFHFLTDLLDSKLDVDRMDYVMRDAYYCGVSFGVYDYLRILHTLRVRSFPRFEGQQHPVWLTKGEHSVEEFLYARFFMYWTVYYHKTTRGFESLLQAILYRAQDLDGSMASVPGVAALLRRQVGMADLVTLDDNALLAQISIWRSSTDSVLADLCGRFLSRRGFKPCGPFAKFDPAIARAVKEAQEHLQGRGLDPKYYLLWNRRETTAYDYYRPEEETEERTPQTSITLEDEQGRRHEIAHRLPGVEALGKASDQDTYYYFPREEEAVIAPMLSGLLA